MNGRRGITAVVLAGALAAAPAQAGGPRYNAFPGSVCVQSIDRIMPSYAIEGVGNQFGETGHLGCPLVMSVGGKRSLATQSMLAASGSKCDMTGSRPAVYLIDQHPYEDAGCTLYVLDQGNAVTAAFTVMSQGESPSRQFLEFAMPRMDFTNKTLFAVCVLPGWWRAQGQDPTTPNRQSSVLSFAVSSCDL